MTGQRSTLTMLGASVCRYARSSDMRTCNHTVEAIGAWVNSEGTLLGTVAFAANHSGIPDDSGGGWSLGSTAWGVHSGGIPSTNQSVFTPIDIAAAALGERLLTR